MMGYRGQRYLPWEPNAQTTESTKPERLRASSSTTGPTKPAGMDTSLRADPVAPKARTRNAVCTIASKNYLGMVRVFAKSMASTNPETPVHVLLVDRVEDRFDLADEPFQLTTIEELNNIPNPKHFFFKYDPIELNTAAKPYFLEHLLQKCGIEKLCYFDPDILVFSRLDGLWDLLDTHSILVTPHITAPYPDDRRPNEIDINRAGVFNLGFVGVARTPATTSLLTWWKNRLYDHCYMNLDAGMHVDQKWFNFVPVMQDKVFILRDPACNIAYWNLHERGKRLRWEFQTLFIDDRPAVFFHFSGLDPGNIEAISKYQDRFRLVNLQNLRPLFEHYRSLLQREGHTQIKQWPYAFGKFENGVRIPQFARDLYGRLDWKQVLDFGDPFSTKGPHTFFAWLNEPEERSTFSRNSTVTHLQMEVYRSRVDLQRVFPDVPGRDCGRFVKWLATCAAKEHGLDRAFQSAEPGARGTGAMARIGQIAGISRIVRDSLRPLRQALIGPVSKVAPREGRLLRTVHALDALCFGDPVGQGGQAASSRASNRVPFGVNVAGYLKGEFGVAETARASLRSLEAVGVPCVLNNVETPIHRQEDEMFGGFSDGNPYRANLVHINADVSQEFARQRGPAYFRDRYSIGYWFWELSQFPRRWLSSFESFQEIWVASAFCQESIARLSPVPVVKMTFPVLVDHRDAVSARSLFGLPDDKFLYGFVFDYMSEVERKNPLGLIGAFRRAFDHRDDAVLVIKTINGEHSPEEVALLKDAGKDCNVVFIDGHLSRHRIASLVASFDSFVSLHRSEGFGIGMAQAMWLGKPVIATGYSGNMDFMNHNNSFLVRYKLAELERTYGPYEKGNVWAEPDLDHAAELMRLVFENRSASRRVSERAAADIRRRMTVDLAGAEMKARLLAVV